MQGSNSWWQRYRPHLPFILILAVTLGLGILMASTWSRYQLNPDAASYFTIAEKYAHGDFRHAANGYWGPMLSWLLVPAVWLHANLIVAAKIIAMLASAGILILLYRFLLKRGVSRLIANLAALGLSSLCISWGAAGAVTPDVLIAFFEIWFAMVLIDFLAKPERRSAWLLGLLGALMYFTKGFGFFLFLGTVGIIALWQWLRVEHNFKLVFRRWLPAGIMFAVLTLPFIGVISVKYHKLTINNAGTYDHHIYGPVGQATSPMVYMGPLAPPNSTAMSVWEDPTLITPIVPDWSPFDSWKRFGFFWNSVIGRNLNTALHSLYDLGPFITVSLTLLFAGALQKKHTYARELRVFVGLSGLMLAGYTLVLAEGRYLWGPMVMAVIGAALVVSAAQRRKTLTRSQILVSGLLLCGITLLYNSQGLVHGRDLDKHWFVASQTLKPLIPSGSNVISDDFSGSFFACHHLKLRCFGVMSAPAMHTDDYYRLLKNQKITYFVDYHQRDDEDMHRFVDKYFVRIGETRTPDHHMTVYKIR